MTCLAKWLPVGLRLIVLSACISVSGASAQNVRAGLSGYDAHVERDLARSTESAPRLRPAPCTSTISSGLATAIQNAAGGAVICLASGTYTGFTLSNVSKSSDVTIQPAPAASVTISGGIDFNVVSHLRFTGVGGSMTMEGNQIDPIDNRPNCSSHLTFDHITYSAGMNILPRCADMAILVDHDVFDHLGPVTWAGRLNVQALNQGPNKPNGVTISNSHFGGGGCGDGIDILGDANGTVIGPGNEFTGIVQSGCSPAHVNPLLLYGSVNALITGNWFHDNGDSVGGIMASVEPGTRIINNVFDCSCIYPWSLAIGPGDHWLIQHNTFAGGGQIRFDTQSGHAPIGNIVRDNVFTAGGGISTDGSDYGTSDHDLNSRQPGTGNRRGKQIFVGGRHPTTYAGYRLAAHSPGKGAASDRTDMGIRSAR